MMRSQILLDILAAITEIEEQRAKQKVNPKPTTAGRAQDEAKEKRRRKMAKQSRRKNR